MLSKVYLTLLLALVALQSATALPAASLLQRRASMNANPVRPTEPAFLKRRAGPSIKKRAAGPSKTVDLQRRAEHLATFASQLKRRSLDDAHIVAAMNTATFLPTKVPVNVNPKILAMRAAQAGKNFAEWASAAAVPTAPASEASAATSASSTPVAWVPASNVLLPTAGPVKRSLNAAKNPKLKNPKLNPKKGNNKRDELYVTRNIPHPGAPMNPSVTVPVLSSSATPLVSSTPALAASAPTTTSSEKATVTLTIELDAHVLPAEQAKRDTLVAARGEQQYSRAEMLDDEKWEDCVVGVDADCCEIPEL